MEKFEVSKVSRIDEVRETIKNLPLDEAFKLVEILEADSRKNVGELLNGVFSEAWKLDWSWIKLIRSYLRVKKEAIKISRILIRGEILNFIPGG